MSDPYLSEIRIFTSSYAPKNWAACDGQIIPINQNQALFYLIGTLYGGDGQTTFALPDLRGRAALHTGGPSLGMKGGESSHTLTIDEMPSHAHTAHSTSDASDANSPANALFATSKTRAFGAPVDLVSLEPGTVTTAGSSQPHQNMQPYLGLNFCIAIIGIFPSQP